MNFVKYAPKLFLNAFFIYFLFHLYGAIIYLLAYLVFRVVTNDEEFDGGFFFSFTTLIIIEF